ncbi:MULTISPECIES: UxaA family hydrolase [Pontibacillus]|uniref:UxaA family hydrolase n=1 Tax=Pontibacillus chungwhensis TaxID=265426 RepID=A0ABY8UVG4_9BACI|nr:MULTISPECIES: UxaA family hydrolase [Pontibacillus]MCD5325244.1 UxaA family hydrolase [Pontibacillus sp. HN14]WIF97492.1 UxaA family hydrolase [Pontibacillus chungwhensis]
MGKSYNSGVATSEKESSSQHVQTHKFLIHHKGDHVGVATNEIQEGEKVIGVYMEDDSTVEVTSKGTIPLGHKIALQPLSTGEEVVKYGVPIGLTTTDWQVGDYVHTHNMKTARW